MRTLFFSVSVAAAASAFAFAFLGCASPTSIARPATTTTTAAGLENEPSAAAPAATEANDRPAGELVCRTKTIIDGTTELYLTWSEGSATGFIRNVAPSGMVYVKPIHAQRHKSMIVVDGPSEPDLVSHTALVSKAASNGKPFMQLGDHASPWTACE